MASWASRFMRSTIERNPFYLCGVRCSAKTERAEGLRLSLKGSTASPYGRSTRLSSHTWLAQPVTLFHLYGGHTVYDEEADKLKSAQQDKPKPLGVHPPAFDPEAKP